MSPIGNSSGGAYRCSLDELRYLSSSVLVAITGLCCTIPVQCYRAVRESDSQAVAEYHADCADRLDNMADLPEAWMMEFLPATPAVGVGGTLAESAAEHVTRTRGPGRSACRKRTSRRYGAAAILAAIQLCCEALTVTESRLLEKRRQSLRASGRSSNAVRPPRCSLRS